MAQSFSALKKNRSSSFDKLNSQMNKLTNDLAQMKANMNAVNGAIQQVNKLIEMIPTINKEKSKK